MKKLAIALVILLVPVAVLAQEEVPRGEIGVSYEFFRPSHVNSSLGPVLLNSGQGFSFRGTYNINRWAALESTFGFQPNIDVQSVAGAPVSGASFNVFHNEWKFKATARQGDKDQVGYFAFVGPGWFRADPNALAETAVSTFTKFSFEFGGGAEVYANRRVGFRFDLGDLVVVLGNINGVDQPRTNNFVFRAGASFRF